MQKRYGAAGPQNGLYKVGKNKWDVFYGFGKDSEDAEHGYNWYERFNHRPSLTEIKDAIVSAIKEESEYRLKYGMEWNGFTVEYSEALKTDLIGILVGLSGGIMSLPQQINLGSNADGTPNTYTFNTIDELGSLSALVGSHRQTCSNEEWEAINALGEMEDYIEEQ